MTIQRLKDLQKECSPDIIFLSKTKNQDDFVTKELKDLNLEKQFLVSPITPGSGGLALPWKKVVDVSINSSNPNFIDSLISFKGKSFNGTFVYGAPNISKHLDVWTQLCDLSASRDFPWFLTGDFNEITDNSEKSGGLERPESSLSNFRSFLSLCDLFDLKHTGNFLSWRGQRHSHLVHCRLDRAMANSSWSDMFPNGRSHYLKFEASDHRPLVSTFDSKRKKKARIFRYDRRLRDNDEISALISKVWNDNPELTVSSRISKCRHAVSAWSKEFHSNRKKLILELKNSLDVALASHIVDDALISLLNMNLLKAYKAEEDFWRQRSRLLWLTLGDKNTSIFHAVTKRRRARNKISVIEGEDGSLVYEDNQIAIAIGSYFQEIFKSSGNSALEVVNKAIKSFISAATNERLTQIPSPQEIRDAMFAIHSDTAPGPMVSLLVFFNPTGK